MNPEVDYDLLVEQAEQKQGGSDPSWTGEVDGYAIKEPLTFHSNGAAIVTFHQPADEKDYTTLLFLNRVDEEKTQPYGKLTKAGAVTQAYVNENRLFKSLARNYATDEQVDAAFNGIKVREFEKKVEALNSLLPDNVAEVTGRAVIGYNAKGYLSFSNRLKWSDDDKQHLPFFTTDPNQKLQPLPTNLTRNKPQVSTEVAADDVAETVDF